VFDESVFKKPIDLYWLKINNLTSNPYFDLILNDDIWQNDILLLKKGRTIDDDILEKLMNFGVKQIKIDISRKKSFKNSVGTHSPESINKQSVLVIREDFKSISSFVKILMESGFKDKNIFAATGIDILNRYLQNNNLNYIFIDHSLYDEKVLNIVEENTFLRIINIFIINAPQNVIPLNYIKTSRNKTVINIKTALKSLNSVYIRALVNQSPSHDYGKLIQKQDMTTFKRCVNA